MASLSMEENVEKHHIHRLHLGIAYSNWIGSQHWIENSMLADQPDLQSLKFDVATHSHNRPISLGMQIGNIGAISKQI